MKREEDQCEGAGWLRVKTVISCLCVFGVIMEHRLRIDRPSTKTTTMTEFIQQPKARADAANLSHLSPFCFTHMSSCLSHSSLCKDVGGYWHFECCTHTHRLFSSCCVCSARWRSTSSAGTGQRFGSTCIFPYIGVVAAPVGVCRLRVCLCL